MTLLLNPCYNYRAQCLPIHQGKTYQSLDKILKRLFEWTRSNHAVGIYSYIPHIVFMNLNFGVDFDYRSTKRQLV